jgi:hypothetical protein
MSGHAVPPATRRGRVWRGLWPDHNPVRRASDRAEAAIVAVLLAAFLIAAPLLALAAGHWMYHSGLRAEHAQASAWHAVPAVLLEDAPPLTPSWAPVLPLVRARWTAPDGRRCTGEVRAPAGARVGRTVQVWVSADGWQTGPPLQRSQLTDRVIFTAVAVPAVLGGVLLSVGILAHGMLERRRLAMWDADWRATGPRWTSRQ